MEPQIIIPPPVPVPPSQPTSQKGFHKSILILVLAYIQLLFCVLSFFSGLTHIVISYSPSILFALPAILVVFTKNKSVYKAARLLVILEYAFILFAVGFLILIFAGSSGGW